MFSLQFTCFEQNLESFIAIWEHWFQVTSARGFWNSELKNIIKQLETCVDAISTLIIWSILDAFLWTADCQFGWSWNHHFGTPKCGFSIGKSIRISSILGTWQILPTDSNFLEDFRSPRNFLEALYWTSGEPEDCSVDFRGILSQLHQSCPREHPATFWFHGSELSKSK